MIRGTLLRTSAARQLSGDERGRESSRARVALLRHHAYLIIAMNFRVNFAIACTRVARLKMLVSRPQKFCKNFLRNA
jgi:hypothetical protein